MLRLFSRRPERALQTHPKEEGLWTSKIRILRGAFWRTNRSYRFSLPIWQKRIAHMAEAEPKFLDRLQQRFTKHHTLGADEQDYTDTAAYAEQFIQHVVRLRDKGRRS
jgi:hypothetical protein